MRKPASEDISQELKDEIYQQFAKGFRLVDVRNAYPDVSEYRVIKERNRFRQDSFKEDPELFNKIISEEQLKDWASTVSNLKAAIKKSKPGSYITKSGLGFNIKNK